MSFDLHDLTEALSAIRSGITIAEAVGIAIPPRAREWEEHTTHFLAGIEGVRVPQDLTGALDEIERIASAFNGLGIHVNVSSIVKAGRSVAATEHNLVSGQAAVLAVTEGQFPDGHDKITIVAYRGRGTFASLVNSGVADTRDISA